MVLDEAGTLRMFSNANASSAVRFVILNNVAFQIVLREFIYFFFYF